MYEQNINAIVVSDGSRILGIGDWGIGGLGICVGKSNLYVAAAGFHPDRILPVVIDVGTNNEELLRDPQYLGLQSERLDGQTYYELLDEFMSCVNSKWKTAVI